METSTTENNPIKLKRKYVRKAKVAEETKTEEAAPLQEKKVEFKTYVRSPSELFKELGTVANKKDYLKENLTFGVASVLQLNFSPTLKLTLPEGAPPYRPLDVAPDLANGRFDGAIKNLSVCVSSSKTESFKKERVFIQVLESVAKEDAEVIIAAKDKKLTSIYPYLTKELVESVAPSLLK